VRIWTGFMWCTKSRVLGFCEHGTETLDYTKMGNCIIERQVTSPTGIWSIDLIVSQTFPGRYETVPLRACGGPRGCEMSRLRHFIDIRLRDGGKFFSFTSRSSFRERERKMRHSFCSGWIVPRDIVWLEGVSQLRYPMRFSGIEAATFLGELKKNNEVLCDLCSLNGELNLRPHECETGVLWVIWGQVQRL
jgi:hypothetical protein